VTGVQQIEIATEDEDQRLDRWFRGKFPELPHGRLEKLLRTGQVRLDGKRAKAGDRVQAGQVVRVPPLGQFTGFPERTQVPGVSPIQEKKWLPLLLAGVLHRDSKVLIIDKPAGLAVQGGTKLEVSLDALLDHLRFDAPERPRLVHRLDRDTSGALVLARSAAAARKLAEAFRHKDARKVYWAIVAGVPKPERGKIDAPLAKSIGDRHERVGADPQGKRATTYYSVLDRAAGKAAAVALMPITGRTHQLRAHCALLGTPILGDRKYGGEKASLPGGMPHASLQLHARRLLVPHPDGGWLDVCAPLPAHMRLAADFLGLSFETADDPFAALEV
jgi:23S rRNA pseudouridine955/2504/2580 synthase